jgi:hypothetical protein
VGFLCSALQTKLASSLKMLSFFSHHSHFRKEQQEWLAKTLCSSIRMALRGKLRMTLMKYFEIFIIFASCMQL